MKKYIVALDQGTTSSRAIVFDKEQKIVSLAQQEYEQIYPQPGYVEHDPMAIYTSQMVVLQEAVLKAGIEPKEIAGIGITNQRETTIMWDKNTGEPVYNAIVWQCRRTGPICDELKNNGYEEIIRQKTGLIIDAYFSATKIKWILDNVEGVRDRAVRGEILFGTVDSWLIYKMTGGKVHVTDYTNASRTMLFNIHTLEWDKDILELLNIPEAILPEVLSSSEIYGSYNIQGEEIPICGIAGDQQAALFGQRCFEKGQAKNTYGTGCFLLMNTGEEILKENSGLLTTIGIGLKDKINYCVEGSVFVGGAVIQWLRDEMGVINNSADSEDYATKIPDNGGVYFVPAFTGLGAPYWDMYARGGIFGLTRGSGREHIIRAAVESMAYQTHDLIDAIEQASHIKMNELKVDGGASRNNFLMQFQSDISSLNIFRPENTETTALGAALLAGRAVSFYTDEQISTPQSGITFSSAMEASQRDSLLSGWHDAVKRTLTK